MIIKIAKDTPKELVNLAKKINFTAIPKSQHNEKISQLQELASKYGVPRRTSKAEAMEIELGECPQQLATTISQMDFSKYNSITRRIAVSFMESWLKGQGLIRG